MAANKRHKSDALVKTTGTSEEHPMKLVIVWDIDETMMIFNSFLTGAWAVSHGVDRNIFLQLGQRWERAILNISDKHFFYTQIEEFDQTCVSDVHPFDDGARIAGYDFSKDGFPPPAAQPSAPSSPAQHQASARPLPTAQPQPQPEPHAANAPTAQNISRAAAAAAGTEAPSSQVAGQQAVVRPLSVEPSTGSFQEHTAGDDGESAWRGSQGELGDGDLRRLAYRYRHVALLYRFGLQSLGTATLRGEWQSLYEETDSITGHWLSHAAHLLQACTVQLPALLRRRREVPGGIALQGQGLGQGQGQARQAQQAVPLQQQQEAQQQQGVAGMGWPRQRQEGEETEEWGGLCRAGAQRGQQLQQPRGGHQSVDAGGQVEGGSEKDGAAGCPAQHAAQHSDQGSEQGPTVPWAVARQPPPTGVAPGDRRTHAPLGRAGVEGAGGRGEGLQGMGAPQGGLGSSPAASPAMPPATQGAAAHGQGEGTAAGSGAVAASGVDSPSSAPAAARHAAPVQAAPPLSVAEGGTVVAVDAPRPPLSPSPAANPHPHSTSSPPPSAEDGCQGGKGVLDVEVVHVAVTSGQLIPSLAKLLLCKLSRHFTPDRVYSSRRLGKGYCFDRVRRRWGPRARFLVIGDGMEEDAAAAERSWPYIRILLSDIQAYPASHVVQLRRDALGGLGLTLPELQLPHILQAVGACV